jgi:hypothetical protein
MVIPNFGKQIFMSIFWFAFLCSCYPNSHRHRHHYTLFPPPPFPRLISSPPPPHISSTSTLQSQFAPLQASALSGTTTTSPTGHRLESLHRRTPPRVPAPLGATATAPPGATPQVRRAVAEHRFTQNPCGVVSKPSTTDRGWAPWIDLERWRIEAEQLRASSLHPPMAVTM